MNQVLEWIRKQDRGGNNTYTALPDDIGVDLPLKSENDLEKLEVYIAEKNNFLALVCIFCCVPACYYTIFTVIIFINIGR